MPHRYGPKSVLQENPVGFGAKARVWGGAAARTVGPHNAGYICYGPQEGVSGAHASMHSTTHDTSNHERTTEANKPEPAHLTQKNPGKGKKGSKVLRPD